MATQIRVFQVSIFQGKRDLVFLDIGANIGLVSIYAVPFCKRIVAVEPSPETFEKLVFNTNPYSVIECVDVALAPHYGPHEFFVNDLNFTASSTVNTYGTKTTVTGVTLSDLLEIKKLGHVDVCKIDAEGSEDESLSWRQLESCQNVIGQYYIECHNTPTSQWEITIGNLVRMFSKLGYHKQTINGMALTASRV